MIFKRCSDTVAIEFFAEAVGRFSVLQTRNGLIEMSFPQRRPENWKKSQTIFSKGFR